ncbi:hypothetical protein GMRT_13496 [Giardia muris]|uniref:Uncharacterized protein n=1 Tax=Giardia muris TaxID=5742 RepID=A0A4Z1T697_GIAMU|nr:hypothetical protein GMRT_13496 [Giardia muris]|eukprot:TNJ27991.1 hypothetical protein GMRT_13496 [Giardia muris]
MPKGYEECPPSIPRQPFPKWTAPEVYHPRNSKFSRERMKEISQKSFLDDVHITETPEDFAPMYSSFTKDGYYREPMLPQIRSSLRSAPSGEDISVQKRGRQLPLIQGRQEQLAMTPTGLATARLLTAPQILL